MLSLKEYDEYWLEYIDKAESILNKYDGKIVNEYRLQVLDLELSYLYSEYKEVLKLPVPEIRAIRNRDIYEYGFYLAVINKI